MSRKHDPRDHARREASKKTRCSVIDGDKTTEISRPEFEAAKQDRDELRRQLEIECWFAEMRTAVLAWQEKMLRFAARMHSEEIHRFVQIQVECELTSRMAAVLVATHGLRPHINEGHSQCVRQSACTIAHAMRNSWAHESIRLLNVTTASDDLYLGASQIKHMPTNGHRHRIELCVPTEQLLARARRSPEKKALEGAIADLFPDRDIDAVTVLNSHVACINKSMKAYRAQLSSPGEYRGRFLSRYGATTSHRVMITCGAEKIPLGEPFSRMLDDCVQMRERNTEAPVLELVQFGRGEFRTGSLEDARNYILELLNTDDSRSRNTEAAADALRLSGYAREELCNGAPPALRDAVDRLYERATQSAGDLLWRGWALRMLARRLHDRVK